MIKKISVISNPFEDKIKEIEVPVVENKFGDLVSKGDFFITTDVLNVRFEEGSVVPDNVYSILHFNCVKYPELDSFTKEQHLKKLDEISKKVKEYTSFDFEGELGSIKAVGEYFIDEVFKTSNILKLNSRVELSSENELFKTLRESTKYLPNINLQLDINEVKGCIENIVTLNAVEQLKDNLSTLNNNYENTNVHISLSEIPESEQHSFWWENKLVGSKIESVLQISYTQEKLDLITLGAMYHDYFNNGFGNYIDINEIDDGEEVIEEPYLNLKVENANSINPLIVKELEKAVEKSYNGNLDSNKSNNEIFKLIAFEVYELLEQYETDLVDNNQQVINMIDNVINKSLEKTNVVVEELEL